MTELLVGITASFTVPERIATDMYSLLWLIPLAISIAVVYKATKLETIKPARFVSQVLVLFGSIIVFITATAGVLLIISWLITQQLGAHGSPLP